MNGFVGEDTRRGYSELLFRVRRTGQRMLCKMEPRTEVKLSLAAEIACLAMSFKGDTEGPRYRPNRVE